MAENEPQITGQGGPEAAEPQAQPDNVVTDNTGQVPVQPVGTSDPTLNDNTNPKVFFDGSDPRNIPPHDSNEQLHIAAAKRIGSEFTDLTTAEDKRREAVEAAYDNSRDVREVIGDEAAGVPTPAERTESGMSAVQREQAARGNRATPPSGRAPKPAKSTTQG
jgi:hypothetical protein